MELQKIEAMNKYSFLKAYLYALLISSVVGAPLILLYGSSDGIPKALTESLLGIEIRFYFLVPLAFTFADLLAHSIYSQSGLFIFERLEEKGLTEVGLKTEFRFLIFEIAISFFVMLLCLFLIAGKMNTEYGLPWFVLAGLYIGYVVFWTKPYRAGEKYIVRSRDDPVLDEIEETTRLRIVKKEKEQLDRVREIQSEIEEVQYLIDEDTSDSVIDPSLDDDSVEEPVSLEDIIAAHNEHIKILDEAERKEVEKIKESREGMDQERELSIARQRYRMTRNSASSQHQRDIERFLEKSSPLKGDKGSSYASLNSEYEKSLRTLEDFRLKELGRINRIRQPTEREKARTEFLDRHAQLKKDLDAQHERAVRGIVRRK